MANTLPRFYFLSQILSLFLYLLSFYVFNRFLPVLKVKEKPFTLWTCHRMGSIWLLVAQETLFK